MKDGWNPASKTRPMFDENRVLETMPKLKDNYNRRFHPFSKLESSQNFPNVTKYVPVVIFKKNVPSYLRSSGAPG
jgi:hypothetical protein